MCSNGARSVTPVGNTIWASTASPSTHIQRAKWYRAIAAGFGDTSALGVFSVGTDDVPDQPMPHDIGVAEVAESDSFDPRQDALDLEQPRVLAVGQIDLRLVASDHGA